MLQADGVVVVLRCPFNNFSKCDGSCPFSMPDFTGCKLSVLLAQVEGQSRGQLAQLNNVNANLEDVRHKLDDLSAKLEEMSAQPDDAPLDDALGRPTITRRKALHQDKPRVLLSWGTGKDNKRRANFTLDPESANAVRLALGDMCGISVTSELDVLIYSGDSKKLSGDCKSRLVTLGSLAAPFFERFPGTKYIYYKLASSNGNVFRFVQTGEVEEEEEE